MAVGKHNQSSPDGGFGIYVHWPFCKAKCPYCDFNSHVRRDGVDQKDYAEALMRELDHQYQYASQYKVSSIFFGGGTPSLMSGETVSAILEHIHGLWDITEDAEISLEANPTSVEAENFKSYAQAGVNRVSLGIQSLRDEDLQFLGRQHTAREAIKALAVARDNFKHVSADMIYTRPGQTPDNWRDELLELLSFNLDHLSLYQLTIEPDTAFKALYDAGKLHIPEEEPARQLYDMNMDICEAAGLRRYEVSNHARLGAECRHNLIYWRYGLYVGVGPGAHGRLMDDMGRFSFVNIKHPETWLAAVMDKGHGLSERENLRASACGDEYLLMGLRLKEGVDLKRLYQISGDRLAPEKIAMLMEEGLITHDKNDGRLALTADGFPVLNQIIAELRTPALSYG